MMSWRVVAVAAFFTLSISTAQAVPLEGSWTGAGYVSPKSGPREKARCLVTYARQSAKVYRVSATCATASASIRQSGTLLEVRSGRYVGDIYNSDFDVRGRLRVTVSGQSQTVTFTSSHADGQLSLHRR